MDGSDCHCPPWANTAWPQRPRKQQEAKSRERQREWLQTCQMLKELRMLQGMGYVAQLSLAGSGALPAPRQQHTMAVLCQVYGE